MLTFLYMTGTRAKNKETEQLAWYVPVRSRDGMD
jgi:hypothetical protein